MIGRGDPKLRRFIDGGDKEYAGLIRLWFFYRGPKRSLATGGSSPADHRRTAISPEQIAEVTRAVHRAIFEQGPARVIRDQARGVPLCIASGRRGRRPAPAPPHESDRRDSSHDSDCEAPDATTSFANARPAPTRRSLARDIGFLLALGTARIATNLAYQTTAHSQSPDANAAG